ncbi:PAS domain S-box protein [Oricola cellulosilytica]|uniref:histidine kinase n=1 Tax=Oricola cellulosilytica TaxID=1429082 RepID=A0A4R0PMT3_9HYPH|nr:PAS domain S-box protein [Oricola cellulosilytica]TCD16599.1 PAS domain S-box protein [Oricola cellulosilytica]
MPETTTNHSFIDVAAWDGVRERFVDGFPMAVLAEDVDELLWVNGPAAALFGFASISEFEAEGVAGIPIALRQIRTAASRISDGGEMRTLLRVTSGLTSKLLPASVRRITGGNGENYVAVLLEDGKAAEDGADRSANAIAGLEEEGAGAALLDAEGEVLASNTLFTGMAIPPQQIRILVDEVAGEDDRLVKRRVPTQQGSNIPVAIARLTDNPARHLIMAVPLTAAAAPVVRDKESEAVPAPGQAEDVAATMAQDDAPKPAVKHDNAVPAADGATAPSPDAGTAGESEHFVADLESKYGPVRFVWKTDSEGRFIDISPEFAATVGPNAADVHGRTFEDVARVFELDPSGEISASLMRRDTWSGKSVMWPVQGTAMRVPVDLAALPSYSRERVFEGYRGFGIVRVSEARPDPEELGLSLVPEALPEEAVTDPEPPQVEPPAESEPPPEVPDTADNRPQEPVESDRPPEDPFRGETPALAAISPIPKRRQADKIIDLNAKRRERPPGESLNPSEQAAFKQIGDALSWARTPEDGDEPPSGETGSETETAGDAGVADRADESRGTPPQEGEAPVQEKTHEAESSKHSPDPAPIDNAGDRDLAASGTEDILPEMSSETETGEKSAYLPSAFATGPHEAANANDKAPEGLTPAVLDELPLALLIHRHGVPLFANRAFAAMTGYENAEALNAAGGIDVLFGGEPPQDGMVHLDRADGDMTPVRAHLQTVPWRGGNALMFAFEPQSAPADMGNEATDIAPGETQLDDAAELRAVLDTATDGVVMLSNDGVIRSLNGSATALFGYTSSEVEGKNFSILFAQESQTAAINYVHGLANNGVASVLNEGLEVLGREKNGGFLPLFMTIGRLEKSRGFCAVVRDITAWKQTEQALLDAQRHAEAASSHKTEFLAKISHEIRTPLNAIIGFSELMAEERFGPIGNERYKSYLADINKSGKHVLDLVNDLLDISKIEAGKQELEFDSVSLNGAVTDAVAMIQPQANRNRVIIRSSLDEELPDVVADSRSLKQIVLNLLSNSVRFTHSGGQVIVSSSYNARGEVVLRIKDTGIGMSSREIETALQPFQQVASLGRMRGDGTGLGLPLTKALVEANRAEFAIQSEPGRGTAVEIVFPPSRVLAS